MTTTNNDSTTSSNEKHNRRNRRVLNLSIYPCRILRGILDTHHLSTMKTSILAALDYLIKKQGLSPNEIRNIIIKTENELNEAK